jgi:isoleucyl-tRNA synthetase
VKEADKEIIAKIKEAGRLVDAGSINHRYVCVGEGGGRKG